MISWYRALDNAGSTVEVVSVSRDYLASWTPQDIGRLPAVCRPGKLRDESDIEHLHTLLVEAYRCSQASGEELTRLQELTGFIVRAAIRIAELTDPGSRPVDRNDDGPTKSASPRS